MFSVELIKRGVKDI